MTRPRVRYVVMAVAAVALAWPAPAGAGGDPPPPTTGAASEPQFDLISIDQSWLVPGQTAVVELAVDDTVAPDLEVAIVAHQAVDSRTRFERTLLGEDLGSSVSGGAIGFPVASLPRTTSGTRILQLGLQDPALPRDPNRLPLSRTNVYPLEFELRDADDNALAEFVLPLVVVAPDPDGTPVVGEKLRVAWVWPLSAAPAILPFGEPDPAVVEQMQPDGRLGRQAAALAAAPDIPFTVAPGPETLDAWTLLAANDAALDAGLTGMLDALETNQVLSGPYVPINIPSLLASGFRDEVGTERARGTEALSARLGRVDPRTPLATPINADALAYLSGASVDRMIVQGEALVPIDSQFTPAQPFTLQTPSGTTTTAAVTDPALNGILTAEGTPALRAQQVLAGLSVVALEQPNAARGIVLANPADWDAPRHLMDAVIDGLRGNHLLQAVDVDQFYAQVPPAMNDDGDTPVVRELQPYAPPPPPVTAAEYDRAQAELNSLRSLIGGADPRILAGERALLTSISSAFDRERARAELGVIGAASNEVLSQIRVPVGSTVTLTARKGEIPVTFLNETDRTLRVKVRLESDKLFFPDGAEREIELPPRNTTVGFTVESRASGTFPLQLTVTSVDEGLVIQSTRVRVRSTFVSGVGVFITIGAALFLAGWWLLHFRRRRRARPGVAA